MTDNANDMMGKNNGLTTLLKTVDSSLSTTTWICHSPSLVVVNTLKTTIKRIMKKNDESDEINKISNVWWIRW